MTIAHDADDYGVTNDPFAPTGYGPGIEGAGTSRTSETKADMTTIPVDAPSNNPTGKDMRAAAGALHAAGCSVIAVKADGSKEPYGGWKGFQVNPSQPTHHDAWWPLDADRPRGLGVVYGKVSGGLMLLEFEGRAVADGLDVQAADAMKAAGLGDLWNAITSGWVEQSPSGGIHLHVRVDGPVPRNTPLAKRRNAQGKLEVLVETRGEGGYAVRAPSGGTVHATGRPYVHVTGTPADAPTVTPEQLDDVFSVLRSLSQVDLAPDTDPDGYVSQRAADGTLRPGDDYNDNGPGWVEILAGHFHSPWDSGDTTYWTREGKSSGVSAATKVRPTSGLDCLYVWSSNADPFEAERTYDKFGAFALLHHGGDIAAASADLRKQGYGTERDMPEQGYTLTDADLDGLDADPSDSQPEQEGDSPEQSLFRELSALSTPDSVWDTPERRWIMDAAEDAGAKREVMAAKILNQVALIAGPNVQGIFDAGRGAFPLTQIIINVGRSGSGSNTSARVVRRILPVPEAFRKRPDFVTDAEAADKVDWGFINVKPSNGSTLLNTMQTTVRVADDTPGGAAGMAASLEGKAQPKKQEASARVFIPRVELNFTEGAALMGVIQKGRSNTSQAADFGPLLLDAYFSEELKQDATSSGRAAIPEGSYVLATTISIQLEHMASVMSQTTGFIQRGLFVSQAKERGDEQAISDALAIIDGQDVDLDDADGFDADDVKCKGPLDGLMAFLTKVNGARNTKKVTMTMVPKVARAVRRIQAGVDNGLAHDHPELTHRAMVLYRVAAGSALLRQSYEISEEDWAFAQAMSAHDRKVRAICNRYGDLLKQAQQSEDNEQTARRTRISEATRASARGESNPLLVTVVRTFRTRIADRGPQSLKQLSDCLNLSQAKDWATTSGGNPTKSALRDAALAHAFTHNVLTKLDGKVALAAPKPEPKAAPARTSQPGSSDVDDFDTP